MTKPTEETSATSLLRNHYPALDGFRGLAVLMVFLIHFGSMVLPYSWLSFGWVGVDFSLYSLAFSSLEVSSIRLEVQEL